MKKVRHNLFVLTGLLVLHLLLLLLTNFTAWPEMLFYPWLLSRGIVLYRDLLAFYPPGAFWLLNCFYRILGYAEVSMRIAAFFWIILSDILLYVIGLKLWKKPLIAATAFLFYIFWQIVLTGNSLWFETMLVPFYLLFFYFLVKAIRREGKSFPLMAGIIGAMMFMIKQTTVLVFVSGLVFLALSSPKDKIKSLINYSWPFLAGVVFLQIYLFTQGINQNLISLFFAVPFNQVGAGGIYIYWIGSDLAYITGAFLPLALLLPFIFNRKIKYPAEPILLLWLSFLLFGLSFPHWALHKIIPAMALSALAVGYVMANLKYLTQRTRIFLILPVIFIVFGQVRSGYQFVTIREKCKVDYFGRTYRELGAFVSEKIDSHPYFVFGNYDYLYLYHRQKPTVLPLVPLFPWNAEIPGIQERLILSLETQRIPYVLYIPYHPDKKFYADYYPQKLGDYIFQRYAKIAPLPNGGLLLKRDENL